MCFPHQYCVSVFVLLRYRPKLFRFVFPVFDSFCRFFVLFMFLVLCCAVCWFILYPLVFAISGLPPFFVCTSSCKSCVLCFS